MSNLYSNAAVLVPVETVMGYSQSTRDEVLASLGLIASVRAAPKTPNSAAPETTDEGPPDFTVPMARKLIAEKISPKTLAVLRTIAESPTPTFHLKDVVTTTGVDGPSELSGAWAGITRRSRNILDDGAVDPIWWDSEPEYKNEMYFDQVGRVSALTHQSLRVAFGIRD